MKLSVVLMIIFCLTIAVNAEEWSTQFGLSIAGKAGKLDWGLSERINNPGVTEREISIGQSTGEIHYDLLFMENDMGKEYLGIALAYRKIFTSDWTLRAKVVGYEGLADTPDKAKGYINLVRSCGSVGFGAGFLVSMKPSVKPSIEAGPILIWQIQPSTTLQLQPTVGDRQNVYFSINFKL